jgi:hypothetical protein
MIFLLSLLSALPSHAGELRDAALREVDSEQNFFQAIYAPADLKKTLFGWDLNAEADRARAAIRDAADGDLLAYQRAFRDFFRSAHDYHVRIVFSDPESSSLPFRVRSAAGRYFVSEIDPNASIPLAVGDEILTFAGQPVDAAVQAVRGTLPTAGRAASDQALAEIALTARSKAKLLDVPQGDVAVTAVRGATGDRFDTTLTWHHVAPQSPLFVEHLVPEIRHDTPFPGDGGSLSPALGSRNGPLPNLGPIAWQAPDSALFRAYEFTIGDRKIGYVRVPDFNGDRAHVKEFADLMARFERETDSLVLDQLNNPGGQSYYLDALASLLSPMPIPTAQFRSAIDSTRYADAATERDKLLHAHDVTDLQKALGAEDLNGFPVTMEFGATLARFDQFLADEWRAGRHVTRPHWRRVETIAPPEGATPYSKPILLLANELDFSCADMFPALLQDRGRARIFGATTAGAGGNNDSIDAFPNLLGIKSYSITVSSELRPDGSYLESSGVRPDLPYSLTARDLQRNYADYVGAVISALQK